VKAWQWKWEVEEVRAADGAVRFVVRARRPDMAAGELPEREYTLAPDQDFLITDFILRRSSGEVTVDSIHAERLGPDAVWFPTKIERVVRRAADHGDGNSRALGETILKQRIQLSDIALNEPIPDKAFSVGALNVSPSVIVLRTSLAGNVTQWRVREGKLIPQDVADSFDKQASTQPESHSPGKD